MSIIKCFFNAQEHDDMKSFAGAVNPRQRSACGKNLLTGAML